MTSTTSGRTWRRGRGLVAGVASLGLAASLLAVGTGSAYAATPYPNWVDNKDLRASCGLDVVLVLDQSTSTAGNNAIASIKQSANTLLSAFADTNSRVGIVEFGRTASQVVGLTDATSDSVKATGALGAAVGSISTQAQRGSNWQDAVIKARAAFTAGRSRAGVQQLLIFVTDSGANLYNGGPIPNDITGNWNPTAAARDAAAAQTNAFKAGGGHVLGIGVGDGFSAAVNLGVAQTNTSFLEYLSQYAVALTVGNAPVGQVAGPDVTVNPNTNNAFNPITTDTLIQPDLSTLGAQFRAIADNVCDSTLTITQRATSATAPLTYGNGGAGWVSKATLTDATGVEWINPVVAGAGAATEESGTSNTAGTSVFQWFKSGGFPAQTVTVTLTPKTNYALQSVLCATKPKNGSWGAYAPVAVNSGQFTVSVGGGQVSCIPISKYIGLPQAVVSLTPRVATKVYGATTTLGGKVLRPSPTVAGLYLPVKGARVAVQYLTAGTSAWKGLRVLTTTSTGAFAFAGKPAFNTTYRIYYAGATGLLGNVSNNALLRITSKVTIKLNKNKVTRGTTVVFSGAVAPNKRGQYVWLQIYSGGHWRNVKAVKLTSTSKYAIAYKTTSRVDYKWRVLKPADVRSYTGASPAITLVVK